MRLQQPRPQGRGCFCNPIHKNCCTPTWNTAVYCLKTLSDLFSLRSLYRACTCTRTAIQTCVCVDHVLIIACGNCVYRALSLTCTTADASVSNCICHNFNTSEYVMREHQRCSTILFYHIFKKNQPFFEKILFFSIFFANYHPRN